MISPLQKPGWVGRAKKLYERKKFVRRNFAGKKIGRRRFYRLKVVPVHIQLWYDYCAFGIERAMPLGGGHKPVFVCFSKHVQKLPTGSFSVVVQHEQTILNASHPQDDAVPSDLRDGNQMPHYLVRTFGPNEGFQLANRIIEYSDANIWHVLNSSREHLYRDKVVHVVPLLRGSKRQLGPRPKASVHTMFGSPHLGRRAELIARLKESGIETTNIFEFDDLGAAFEDCAILINYSQFAHFRTLEELRIVPALLQRVVVITEPFPYPERIDVSPFVVAAAEPSIEAVVQQTRDNYFEIWDKLFGDGRFEKLEAHLTSRNDFAFKDLAENS